MLKFSRIVARSMQASRRTQPLPQDFAQALAQLDLRSSELEADLSLAIPAEATQLPLLPSSAPAVPTQYVSANAFDDRESRTTTDKFARTYVPKHFPSFPSEHTFHATPVFTLREVDARKVREQATHDGMEAEKALRKLMAASKAAVSSRRQVVGGDAQRQKREEIWRETMEAVQAEDERTRTASQQDSAMFGMDGARDLPDDIGSIEVNYDKLFGRRERRLGA
jgi:transcription initiation factor TFIID subunit 8